MVGGWRGVANFLLASDVSLRKAIFCTHAFLTPPLRNKKKPSVFLLLFFL